MEVDDRSMDMMATMMMQMEKFPEFSEPFYQEPPLISTSNITMPMLHNNMFNNNTPPHPPPPPTNNNSNNNNNNNIIPFVTTNTINPIPPHHLILHQQPNSNKNNASSPSSCSSTCEEKKNSMAAMREMIFRIAVMQPIHIDPESIKPPKRRNVKISKDPQSVAARHRRERISERIRILQRLVPGGTKMDTASMLDEAIHYVKFLKKQVQTLEQAGVTRSSSSSSALGFGVSSASSFNNNMGNHNNYYSAFMKDYHQPSHHQMVASSMQTLS